MAVLLAGICLTGCGKKGDRDRNGQGEEGLEAGHAYEVETPAGAYYKPGKGVILTDETRKILGVEIAEVTEQKLPNELEFNIQIFGEKHQHATGDLDHTGCDVHGSGLVSTEAMPLVKTGQLVRVTAATNPPLNGVVLSITKAIALGETELVVGVSNATAQIKPGDFVTGKITVPRDGPVIVAPKSAVLRTPEGSFVYTVNGDAYLRTVVKTGAEANGFVEIKEGLPRGDQVVAKPVETLWLIELRATKGGGHSH